MLHFKLNRSSAICFYDHSSRALWDGSFWDHDCLVSSRLVTFISCNLVCFSSLRCGEEQPFAPLRWQLLLWWAAALPCTSKALTYLIFPPSLSCQSWRWTFCNTRLWHQRRRSRAQRGRAEKRTLTTTTSASLAFGSSGRVPKCVVWCTEEDLVCVSQLKSKHEMHQFPFIFKFVEKKFDGWLRNIYLYSLTRQRPHFDIQALPCEL